MSTKKSQIDQKILDRIRSAYKLASDNELAEFLGVKQNTITTWRRRESFNLDIIIQKCVDLNLNWLFYGDKPIFRREPEDEKYGELTEFVAVDVFERIKKSYEYTSDKQVWEHLGISKKEFIKWRRENTIDWNIVNEKCPDIHPLYLMGKQKSPDMITRKEHQVEEEGGQHTAGKDISKRIKNLNIKVEDKVELLEMLLDIYEQKSK